MWRDETFNQRNKATKRVGEERREGVGQNLRKR